MKRFLGLAVLILGFSVPAHAQAPRTMGMTGGSGPGGAMNTSGGGGAGSAIGSVSFQTLPSIPPSRLPSTAVSGSNATFEPSTFLPYDQAVAAGQAVLDARHRSVAQAAAENAQARKLKAKASIIESAAGTPVITRPQ